MEHITCQSGDKVYCTVALECLGQGSFKIWKGIMRNIVVPRGFPFNLDAIGYGHGSLTRSQEAFGVKE